MTHNLIVLCSALALGSAAQVASAGAPELTVDANLGGVMQQIMPTGIGGESGYLYERDILTDPLTVNVGDGTIDLGWSWLADPSISRGFGGPVSVMGGLVVSNNTLATQTISLQTTLPLSSAILPSSVIGGSVAATLTASADGGTLSTSGSTAFYQGMIDGLVVPLNAADLVPAPMSSNPGPFESGGFLNTNFGAPIPSQPAGAINTSIGILITFELSAGDSMSFTSVFVADIPTPGSAAILFVAGLMVNRRRR